MLAVISWTGGSAFTVTTPANYAMNMTNSDLTVAGADFNKELDVYTGDISIPVSVAANAYEYSYGFTKVGVPGATGVAGTYLVRISVPTAGANSNIWVSAAVDHVNSAGVVLNTSGFAPTELQGTAGSKEFTFTNPILGTWSAGDRLRISYRFHNLASITQSITVGHSVAGWDYQNMVTTPAGMTERIDRGPTPAIESAELLQALAGPTGVKTATAVRSGVGAAHILALKPGPGGGTAVQCGGIDYLETLCIRATPASGPG